MEKDNLFEREKKTHEIRKKILFMNNIMKQKANCICVFFVWCATARALRLCVSFFFDEK